MTNSKLTINEFGNKIWRNENGELHREDGPAIEYTDSSKEWWIDGKRHRSDGAAIEYGNGYRSWYYHGKYINCHSQEEFERFLIENTFK